MVDVKTCFVAYPDRPSSLVEIVEDFISKINSGGTVTAASWKETNIGGRFVITAICNRIDACDLFICDLTYLNRNVLFELGYAIAKNKTIWIIRDPSIHMADIEFKRFELLMTVGYTEYNNIYDLIDSFYRDQPYNTLHSVLNDALDSLPHVKTIPSLIYLRSAVRTEASVRLTQIMTKSSINLIIDDPDEVRSQTLTWYLQELHKAFAMVGHLLSDITRDSEIHNAKVSFVAGLCQGFGKHLLLLAHDPYNSPIDYKEILNIHKTATRCEDIITYWLNDVETSFDRIRYESANYAQQLRDATKLQKLSLGSLEAEHESQFIAEYFVETGAYYEAQKIGSVMLIGRKGSGKTAMLYKLASDIELQAASHVCIIKPIDYELEGVIQLLGKVIEKAERGFLIESFWKYLIYSELAKSIYEQLLSKPAYYQPSRDEESLMTFVRENHKIILPDFTERMDGIVQLLQIGHSGNNVTETRLRISELLHSKIIGQLRTILGKVLAKFRKVAVLIDNLDKAWRAQSDFVLLSDLLIGLLRMTERIYADFHKDSNQLSPVNLSIVIFLRSDIFGHICKHTPERDKINHMRLLWDDHGLLIRIIEERLIQSSQEEIVPTQIWKDYFCQSIGEVPIREFIIDNILPRPRDIIYLVKEAHIQAVNSRRNIISEIDIKAALEKYSSYALGTIIAESTEEIEELLYEFVKCNEVITRLDLESIINGKTKMKTSDTIEHLCDLTFLGREVDDGTYAFQYNDDHKLKFTKMAQKVSESHGSERFRIHPAFHQCLGIKRTILEKEHTSRLF